jgi:mRNA interferase HigB
MRIISRRTLRQFASKRVGHKDANSLKHALDAWFHEVLRAKWKNTSELKRRYATASIISADRVVFNINGNAYRLIAAIDFEKGIVWIKWLGTHRAYDQIDALTVQHGKSN